MPNTKKGAGGRPPGRADNPMNKRTRAESEAAKKRRIDKTAATRKANEAKKRADIAASTKEAAIKKRNDFFRKMCKVAAETEMAAAKDDAAAAAAADDDNDDAAAAVDDDDDDAADKGGREEDAEAIDDVTSPADDNSGDEGARIDNNIPINKKSCDVIENLDIGEDDRPEDYFDNDDGFEEFKKDKPLGVQQAVVKVITERLAEEVREANKSADTWLLKHLKENDWWIRKEHARKFAKRLGLKAAHHAYYRDIYVFLPDVKYGKEFTPCCPNCKTNNAVGNNGFRENHFGRLIVGMNETYYTVTRRYRCYDCEQKNKDLCGATTLEEIFEENGVRIEKTVDKLEYTFMGWDKRIMHLYPNGVGMEFPAFLTWRAGIDNLVLAVMRPLFNKGLKPEQLAKMLLELHSAEYDKLRLLHEYKIKSIREGAQPDAIIEPLGSFSDPDLYRGVVPTGAYLEYVYKEMHKTIRPFLDKEVKKRSAESLHWDASFKEAGNLSQCHGKPIFKGLVTGLNEYGEIRIQFHFCTESHEQMIAALQAFERTRKALGFPGFRHVYTDNPRKDMSLFFANIPSVREQQERYNRGILPQTDVPIPAYPFDRLAVRKAVTSQDIRMVVDAMKEDIGSRRLVGLDTEWNRVCRPNGMQCGRSKIKWIQLAYRNEQDKIQVLLLWVGDLTKLPNTLESLLCDNTLTFVGNRVSTDLKYIGGDFKVKRIMDVDQNERENVVNVGMYARVRDVVQNATVGLDILAQLTLNLFVDKSQQISTWTKELAPEQEQYVAIDAAVSLEVFEELEKKPDLTRRLKEEEATDGKKVDLIPANGSVACMATRAATGTIVKKNSYTCPEGFLLKTKRGNKRIVTVGRGTFVVRIEKIYSPALILPRYLKRLSSSTDVALEDLGEIEIVVPLAMLKEHVACDNIRATPIHRPVTGRSQPVTEDMPRRSERGLVKRKHSPTDGYESEDSEIPDNGDLGDESDDDFEEEKIEEDMKELTPAQIELLRAAIFESEEILDGKVPLQCDKLEDPPKPEDIPNRFSACLGDPFHEMDRPSASSTKHEFKKPYYVALREAIYVWNPVTMAKLHARMKASGKSDQEIEAQKYYNASFFRECVDRVIPPPKILYYRLRAVFVFFGNKVDSKTKQPLFNETAWKKANNVLKDARDGLFSDPPDIELYSLKLWPNGEGKKNKYGLALLDCKRGTNRTEACHKHVSVTFKSWHVGNEMSNCLLGEFRHRYNHNCSQRRRYGFPVTGHYNTWIIDQLQNLTMENHGIQLYPHWTNASDFRSTDESFDTIPLHNATLHEALEKRCKELDNIKLTRERAYIAKSMGTTLPFLPVVHKEEYKAFAKLVLNGKGPIDFDVAAVEWCKYVDGKNIMPKLPSQLRTHYEEWSRKKRIEDSLKEARPGMEMLDELNRQITLRPANEHVHDGMQSSAWKQPSIPAPLLHPPAQALQHAEVLNVVGGIAIGKDAPSLAPSNTATSNKRRRRCGVCSKEGCKGSGGRKHCHLIKASSSTQTKKRSKADDDGSLVPAASLRRCQLCLEFGAGKHENCIQGSKDRDHCKYYFRDGNLK